MRFCYTLLTLVLLLTAIVAVAAPSPATATDSASQQQKRQQQQRHFYQQRLKKQGEKKPLLTNPQPKAKPLPENGLTFHLKKVVFSPPSHFISKQTLRNIAAPYEGKEVTFKDINSIVAQVNAIYTKKGIITALAIVPPQDINNGIIKIRLVEGRLGKLYIDGNKVVDDSYYEKRFSLTPNKVIDVPKLRRDMQLINHTNNAKVHASMRAGGNSGQSDVILRVNEPHRTLLQLFADNNGSENTGRYRGGMLAQVYGLAGRDDLLTVQALGTSQGASFNGFINYELPVNTQGGRVNLSYQQGDIKLVEGPFVDLGITGNSKDGAVKYGQPVFHRNNFWIDAYGKLNYTDTKSLISGYTLSQFKVWQTDAGLAFSGQGKGYSWQVRQSLSWANVENLFGKKTGYPLANGSASFSRLWGKRWVTLVRSGWQYGFDNLVPAPLRFQVGGVSSVRGYEQAAISGNRGIYGSFELQYRFPHVTPFVFSDAGLINNRKLKEQVASSVGLGVRLTLADFLVCNVAWGHTLRKVKPDQDKNRVHARLAYYWPGY